jgi:altered-inheritance-of-mitochondria protein 13
VAEELKRLHAREEETLNSLLSSGEAAATDAAEHALSEGDHLRKLSRESVQNEISALKKKLDERKKVQDISALDKEVESARIGVVDCLRTKEGRSLDCWREVEAFRDGVRKLEDSWVEKQVR